MCLSIQSCPMSVILAIIGREKTGVSPQCRVKPRRHVTSSPHCRAGTSESVGAMAGKEILTILTSHRAVEN